MGTLKFSPMTCCFFEFKLGFGMDLKSYRLVCFFEFKLGFGMDLKSYRLVTHATFSKKQIQMGNLNS